MSSQVQAATSLTIPGLSTLAAGETAESAIIDLASNLLLDLLLDVTVSTLNTPTGNSQILVYASGTDDGINFSSPIPVGQIIINGPSTVERRIFSLSVAFNESLPYQAKIIFVNDLQAALTSSHATVSEVREIVDIPPGTISLMSINVPGLDVRYSDGTTGTVSSYLQEGAVKISSVDPKLVEEKSEFVLLSPDPKDYERFGSSLYVQRSTSTKTILVGAPGTRSTGTGVVYSFRVSNIGNTSTSTTVKLDYIQPIRIEDFVSAGTGTQWGSSISGADDCSVVAIGAPGYPSDPVNTGVVLIFTGTNTTHVQTIASPFGIGGKFGSKVSLSATGDYLFVSAIDARTVDQAYGKVAVYTLNEGQFELLQIISNPVNYAGMKFGFDIDINEQADTVIITSLGTNKSLPTSFDLSSGRPTTFDSASTDFYGLIKASGTAYVYNRKMSKFIFAEELAPVSTDNGTDYGYSVAFDNDVVLIGSPSINNISTSSGVYQFNKDDLHIDIGMNTLRSQDDSVNVEVFDKVSLINVFNEEVLDYLDVIDPVKGKISGIADQEIKYKSAFDPAVYSIGITGTVNDTNTNWLDEHVGELWWDLSTAKYTWYEQGDLTYRKNNWGKLFPGSTIDIYEWVGSQYLPSEWSSRADTPEGLTEGISGQPKYADNTVVSVKQVYNYVTNSFYNVYYYWIKNKITVPNAVNRRISGYQVSSIIADPLSYGLKYAAILSKDSVALSNVGPELVDDRIHLNIAYDDNPTDIQRHTEWLLLQEGAENSRPNTLLEKKLFDSLLGHDHLGNPVPDPTLTSRTRYGLGIRPQQTLFKNRIEALRNLVEFTNSVLIKNLITGNYDFTNLNSQEQIPDEYSGEYDQIVEDTEGLLLIDTQQFIPENKSALSCTVYNGKIRGVRIDNPGFGYRIAPTVTIESDSGSGAIISTKIDSLGRIISANIENAGSGYVNPPVLKVRPYTVIVLIDNLYSGKWTKFIYDIDSAQWVRSHTQKYNTTLYWKYVDWSSENYNPFLDYENTVDDVYQINELNLTAGQYVKVKNGGDGRYIILEKTNGSAGTFSDQFNIVYSENGTIQILDSIWNSAASSYGFDQNGSYDQTLFDQTPDLELQYILTALRDDLFVNELKINYNLFFFKAVKYALSEQKLLDWAFKTSFINVTNYAGQLDQRPVYKLQNSSYFEDYLKEVKPYHTNVRNYTTNYNTVDPSRSYTTDFDLPSVYNKETEKFESIGPTSDYLLQYPWKSWADNYSFELGSVIIGYPGSGYTLPPSVTIKTADGDSGTGATGKAYIRSGEVIAIEVTNPGSDYKKPPIVILEGGGDTLLTPATAYAQLSNNKIRTNKISLKFDRINTFDQIGDLEVVDRIICNGSRNSFILNWNAQPQKSQITVFLDGILVLGSDYTLKYYTEKFNGYTKKYTKLVFINGIPGLGQVLEIRYLKDISLLSATERILNLYSPKSGMPGKDLPQLMSGIEYPKTQIETLSFDYTTKWDTESIPFGQASYADDVNFYTTTSIANTSSAGSNSITVTRTTGLIAGQFANIISTTSNRFGSTMVAIESLNTATRVVTFNSTLTASVFPGDVIEFWSYDSSASILDSAIEGGTWNGLTGNHVGGLGIRPEDIVIDGDNFITSNTDNAPEEFVPGQSADSVGINVYTKNPTGAPVIFSSNFDVYASNSNTVKVLSITPPAATYITVSFDNKIFAYNTTTNFTTSTEFTINWATNELIIPPQTVNGKLGYTVISIGGGRSDTEAGVIDSDIVTTYDSTAQVQSLSDYNSIKSAYVAVNGIAISATTSTDNYGYMLTHVNEHNYRAAVNVYNLPPGENTVQAWFFANDYKYFNEIKEEVFNAGNQAVFELSHPPGNIEPAVAQAIVEIVENGQRRRLRPPYISYYEVVGAGTTFAIDSTRPWPPNTFPDKSKVRVYVNGNALTVFDFDLNATAGTITIHSEFITLRDVVAIVGLPEAFELTPDGQAYQHLYDYDIIGNELRLPDVHDSGELRVLTFTDHDGMMMRTERFDGNPSRRYKISRAVIDVNYIWVQVNGIPLTSKLDYEILDDQVTVQISDAFVHTQEDDIVISSISSTQLASTILGYRIFTDIFNRTHFKRLSKQNSTYLTQPLKFTDTEIHVADSTVISDPIMHKKMPGVVIIDGERIEFFVKEGNVLKQLRRSTLGTSPSYYSQENTKVIDQSYDQTIPYNENIRRQYHYTTSTVNNIVLDTDSNSYTFVINTTTSVVNTGTQNQVSSDGITLSKNPSFRAVDQVLVYYGGRLLRKDGMYSHDTTLSYDSPQFTVIGSTSTSTKLPDPNIIDLKIGDAYIVTATNQVWIYGESSDVDAVNGFVYRGLRYLPPEFTINTSTQALTIHIAGGVSNNIKIAVVKKEVPRNSVWNNEITTSTTLSLMNSTTVPAKFLQIRPAELPDRYYYGGDDTLVNNSGFALTDGTGEPLEGF
jgi:hypothetical protein